MRDEERKGSKEKWEMEGGMGRSGRERERGKGRMEKERREEWM